MNFLSAAKLVEEMKTLPARIVERLSEDGGDPIRRRQMRRLHPMMLEELMHMPLGEAGDPVGILMAASIVRDDMPWLYELAMEVYRAVKSGEVDSIEREVRRLRRFSELMMSGPFMEEFGINRKDGHMMAIEFPRMLDHTLRRALRSHRVSTEKSQKPSAQTDYVPE